MRERNRIATLDKIVPSIYIFAALEENSTSPSSSTFLRSVLTKNALHTLTIRFQLPTHLSI